MGRREERRDRAYFIVEPRRYSSNPGSTPHVARSDSKENGPMKGRAMTNRLLRNFRKEHTHQARLL